MNTAVLRSHVRKYLIENLHTSAAQFILQSHPVDIDNKVLVQQFIGLQKARKKFPFLFDQPQIIYPPKVNLEQTSSWETALYKANITRGDSIIDLTGGMGIDAIAFAKAYSTTTHVELNSILQEIASHNFKALEVDIRSFHNDGIEYLKETEEFYDLIYLDPSRKTAATSKAVRLEDYEPNVIEHQELIFNKGKKALIKTSPMLDITAGLQQLKRVAQIHVVAVKNEVKELLWLLDKTAATTQITAVNLQTNQTPLRFDLGLNAPVNLQQPSSYLYEPNAALMKAQAFSAIHQQLGLDKIDKGSHFFTSDQLINFPGRRFKIKQITDYKPKTIKRLYGKTSKAVVSRNFRESVKQLRSKYKLTEHDTDYLFFTHVVDRGPVVIEAQKLD